MSIFSVLYKATKYQTFFTISEFIDGFINFFLFTFQFPCKSLCRLFCAYPHPVQVSIASLWNREGYHLGHRVAMSSPHKIGYLSDQWRASL